MKKTNQKENVRGVKYSRRFDANKARDRPGAGRACTGRSAEDATGSA